MNLDKLFWSRTKTDILKYLVFRRQGISLRAFETELSWSFPAIKKQVDQLDEAWVVHIQKDNNRRSIYLVEGMSDHIKLMFLYALHRTLLDFFESMSPRPTRYFLWNLFWYESDIDLVLIYAHDLNEEEQKESLESAKVQITEIFRKSLLEIVNVAYMSQQEYDKRYRLADKFVLMLMTKTKEFELENVVELV